MNVKHKKWLYISVGGVLIIAILIGLRIARQNDRTQTATQHPAQAATNPAPSTRHSMPKSDVVATPGAHQVTFDSDGISRTYTIYLPKGYDATRTYPVLLGFHGGFGSAEQFEQSSRLDEKADTYGFIVVYGQGTSWGRIGAPVWNAGDCCGQAVTSQKNVDDVGYVRKVIQRVGSEYWIDTQRVYATGMSNGAMLSHRLACEASDVIHGVAAVSGTIQVSRCAPSQRVPVLMMQGTDDPRVLYSGGTTTGSIRITSQPVDDVYAAWAQRNGCATVGSPSVTSVVAHSSDNKTVDRIQYPSCAVSTVLYRINGGVHEWPGGNSTSNILEQKKPTQVVDASQIIVDFFGLTK